MEELEIEQLLKAIRVADRLLYGAIRVAAMNSGNHIPRTLAIAAEHTYDLRHRSGLEGPLRIPPRKESWE